MECAGYKHLQDFALNMQGGGGGGEFAGHYGIYNNEDIQIGM